MFSLDDSNIGGWNCRFQDNLGSQGECKQILKGLFEKKKKGVSLVLVLFSIRSGSNYYGVSKIRHSFKIFLKVLAFLKENIIFIKGSVREK